MAVLEAVRGWEALDPEAREETLSNETETEQKTPNTKEEPRKWDMNAINALLREDTVSLLLQHDAHISEDDAFDEGARSNTSLHGC